MNSDVPRPSQRVPDLPTEIDELVLGATARDPIDRFPSAADFLAELRRVRTLMPPADPLPEVRDAGGTTVILSSAAAPEIVEAPEEAETIGLLGSDVGQELQEQTGSDDDEAVAPRRGRRALLLAGLLALGLVAGLVWAFAAGPLQRATVPSVVGLPVADAEALLAASELRFEVGDQQYSETAPKDTVISQDPAAESTTFIRFPVNAVVSLGPERYEVPDVRGQSVEEATATITATKLAVGGQTEAFDEEVPAGAVIGTDPAAGTSLKPQAAVTLIVSQGPAPRPVPDVLGKPATDAQAALEAVGLVAQTSQDYSEKYPAGTVASTTPPVGTEVEKGSTVSLVVSKGPPPVEVPRVVDMKRDEAINKLQSLGFKVNVQTGVVTPLDRVYSQDPPPGESRPKGSTVTISIF